MSIIFKCECGRDYELEDENTPRTIHCLICKRPITVPVKSRPEIPSAVTTTGVQSVPTDPHPQVDSAASRSDLPSESPRIKRGFNLTDLALAGGGILMVAAFLWYFVGYRIFGGERLYPAGVLFLTGLLFIVRIMMRDMQN
ncbi:MAG TPA: hypothetical protein VN688_28865 [Gemmataceae bacterium]|nr:hypothetical protein [Gemmataceae bacterium]